MLTFVGVIGCGSLEYDVSDAFLVLVLQKRHRDYDEVAWLLLDDTSFANARDYFMTEKQLKFADALGLDPSETFEKAYADGDQISKVIQVAINDRDAFVLLYPGKTPAAGTCRMFIALCVRYLILV